MKVSDLIDIWVGGVNNINELPVGKVGKRRSLLACPHFFVLVVALGGIGQKWREGSGSELWLCCVVCVCW